MAPRSAASKPGDVFLPAAGSKPPAGPGSGKILGVNKWVFIGAVGAALVVAYIIWKRRGSSTASTASTPTAQSPTDQGLTTGDTGAGQGSGGGAAGGPTGPDPTSQDQFGGLGNTLASIQDELASLNSGVSNGGRPNTTYLLLPNAGTGAGGASAGGGGGNQTRSVQTLANGATLTTMANGRQIEQAPGHTPYVTNAGGGSAVSSRAGTTLAPAPPKPAPKPQPKAVTANKTGATTVKGRGVISIH